MHKGYTNWTWALHSVSEGDDIVFIVGKTTYKLQGDPDKLLKYIASKATVTGQLDGTTLNVETIKVRRKGSKLSLGRTNSLFTGVILRDFCPEGSARGAAQS